MREGVGDVVSAAVEESGWKQFAIDSELQLAYETSQIFAIPWPNSGLFQHPISNKSTVCSCRNKFFIFNRRNSCENCLLCIYFAFLVTARIA